MTEGQAGSVELASFKIIPADHCPDCAGSGINRHQGSFDNGRLIQLKLNRVVDGGLQRNFDHVSAADQLRSRSHGNHLGLRDRRSLKETTLGPKHIGYGYRADDAMSQDGHVLVGHVHDQAFDDFSKLGDDGGRIFREHRRWVLMTEHAAPPLSFIEFAQSFGDGRLGQALQLKTQSREHVKASFIHQGLAEFVHQVLANVFKKIRSRAFDGLTFEGQCGVDGLPCLGFRKKASVRHSFQHVFLSLFREGVILVRRIGRRGLRQAGEKRRFGEREF